MSAERQEYIKKWYYTYRVLQCHRPSERGMLISTEGWAGLCEESTKFEEMTGR